MNNHNLTVDIPPWPPFNDPTAPLSPSSLSAALHHYTIPSAADFSDDDDDLSVDAFSCDEFRMYEFKIRRCNRARSHDWTNCPFAHPGEKAKRRDPRKFRYHGISCTEFRKGCCKRGDTCEYAHGVFECWLHPSRYRTQPCKDGVACRRRVCFFAHTPDQLRFVPQQQQKPQNSSIQNSFLDSYDGSPLRMQGADAYLLKAYLSSVSSPPVSPSGEMLRRPSWSARSNANEMMESLRKLQLGKVNSPTGVSGQVGNGVVGSPRASVAGFMPVFYSLPSTPTRLAMESGGVGCDEKPAERVESGRALRARMVEKLSKDGGIGKKLNSDAEPARALLEVSDMVN